MGLCALQTCIIQTLCRDFGCPCYVALIRISAVSSAQHTHIEDPQQFITQILSTVETEGGNCEWAGGAMNTIMWSLEGTGYHCTQKLIELSGWVELTIKSLLPSYYRYSVHCPSDHDHSLLCIFRSLRNF